MLPKTQFRTQPQFPVEIDQSKSFARGIIRCNIANNRRDLSLSRVKGEILTQLGRVPSINNAIGIVGGTYPNFPVTYTTGLTANADPRKTFLFAGVLPEAGKTLTGWWRAGANFCDAAWSATGGGYYPRVRLNSPFEVTYFATSPTKFLKPDTFYAVAFRVAAADFVDVWWDGVKQLSTTTTSSFSDNAIFNFGGSYTDSGPTAWPLRELQGMWIWDRTLSDGELSALTQNPWQVFRPANSERQNLFIEVFKPSSDITVTGWTGSPDNVNLYANIDEPSASDTDYILSPSLSGTPGPAIFGLSPSSLAAGNYTVNLRARRTGVGGQVRALLVNSSGTTVGTSSWQTLTTTYTTYNLAITTTGTAARLRFEVQE